MFWPPRHTPFLKYLALFALSIGCQAEIGDSCSLGTDCSQTGSRTCDNKMPNGYCTIYNCEHDDCPEEAACIGFMVAQSTASECVSTSDRSRLKTFCMRRCSSDGDCRSGYTCEDLNEPNNLWNSVLVDTKHSNGKVCAVAYSALAAIEKDESNSDYCTAGTYEDDGYYDVTSGGAGGQSSTSSGDSGGTAGQSSASSVGGSSSTSGT